MTQHMHDHDPAEMPDEQWLEQFDRLTSEHKTQSWDGTVQPSSGRFFTGYEDLSVALRLARWLSRESGVPVDLSVVDGVWSFSPEARRTVERLVSSQDEERQYRHDVVRAAEEHWELNEDYYKARLSEDATWGRDALGKPYGLPGA